MKECLRVVFLNLQGEQQESFFLSDFLFYELVFLSNFKKDFLIKIKTIDSWKKFLKLYSSLLDEVFTYTSVKTPVWSFVAARLLLLKHYLKFSIHKKEDLKINYLESFFFFIKKSMSIDLYSSFIVENFIFLKKIAVDVLNFKLDFLFSYSALNFFYNRYSLEVEEYFEFPQWTFLLIAFVSSFYEKKVVREVYIKKIYFLLSNRYLSLATPILLNMRKNASFKTNLSSCFIISTNDNIEDIYHNISNIAKISKNAGGVGILLSNIRSQGSFIKNKIGLSNGVVPVIKVINDTSLFVNQQGKRAGAVTVALDIWHLDILEFLEIQLEQGDVRRKSFNVFPQVVISDLFMKRVLNNHNWFLFDPEEIRRKYSVNLTDLFGERFEEFYCMLEKDNTLLFKKKILAKELFKRIMKAQVETGLPYLFFKDTVNNNNINSHDGYIGCGNLCQESFSNFCSSFESISKEEKELDYKKSSVGLAHVCILSSINLASLAKIEEKEFFPLLLIIAKYVVRFLDNVTSLTTNPILEADKHCNRYRIIGIGYMGLADLIAKRKLFYSSIASLQLIDTVFEYIALHAIKESILLSKERGKYSVYNGSKWSKGLIFNKDINWYKKNSKYFLEWKRVFQLLSKYGIRNGSLFSSAPNTASSIIQDATAGILPIWSKFYFDQNAKGLFPIFPPFLLKYSKFYIENKNLNQKLVVDVVSAVQKWIDQGISMELVFDLNRIKSIKEIYSTLIYAWKKKCKTVYYLRFIQKNSDTFINNKKKEVVLKKHNYKISCEGCEN